MQRCATWMSKSRVQFSSLGELPENIPFSALAALIFGNAYVQ